MSNFVAGSCKKCGGVVIFYDVYPPQYLCSDCGKMHIDTGEVPKWVKE